MEKTITIDKELISLLDRRDMLGAIRALPDQLESSYASARACLDGSLARGFKAAGGRPAGVVVCGMGGSAIGADLVLASLSALDVPAAVVRGYDLPAWTDRDTLVIGVSYSGNTEETLSCLTAALERGCSPVCVASGGQVAALATDRGLPLVVVPGGQQPRASVGLLAAPLLAALEAAGLCASQADAVRETGELLRVGNEEQGPDAPEADFNLGQSAETRPSAGRLAARLRGCQTVVYGAGATAAAARRWKGQLNENAKAPAFWNELPELNHNEIMGWSSLPDVSKATVAVFLHDQSGDRRLARRAELTGAVLAERGVRVEHVGGTGESQLARLFTLVQFGDYVSFYLALLYGIDPSPVPDIEEFKARLSSSGA